MQQMQQSHQENEAVAKETGRLKAVQIPVPNAASVQWEHKGDRERKQEVQERPESEDHKKDKTAMEQDPSNKQNLDDNWSKELGPMLDRLNTQYG